MTRKIIIAGNWKMHKTPQEAGVLAQAIVSAMPTNLACEVVLCPSHTALATVSTAIAGSAVQLGAQNCHWEAQGAFTGETSPAMLAGWCQYVIIGHSERRQFFGEINETVNRKVKSALKYGLTPIICVGENLAENEAGLTQAVVSDHVNGAYAGLSAEDALKTVIAYEPVWAIGTGKTATAQQADDVIGLYIRPALAALYDEVVAQSITIQYGGSVKASNAAELLGMPNIDGALVGGASLQAGEFLGIVAGASAKS
ncbi:MAG TPA: triose-phosphate isomerase [Anaerolineales bacterium]|nr:triose-phosphate isomerase [Anaerolineales bacterium]